jgi:sec-independent protein translocase protein TatC
MKLHLARPRDPIDSTPGADFSDGIGLSVLRHLDELRRRIVYACAGVGVGMIASFFYIKPIFDFVFQPIRSALPPGSKLIYTQPGEAFSIWVSIALIAGVVLAIPWVMYQMWRVITPALEPRFKRYVVPFILLTTIGFVGGALFNHFIVFRMMIVFFASFSSADLNFMPKLDDVFGLYTKMLFGMGLVFQMPALIFFLAKMGLVTWRFLLRNLKYAILVIFIIAAVITPSPDMTVQTMFALPMVGLYLLSIVIAWMVGPVARPADDALDDL